MDRASRLPRLATAIPLVFFALCSTPARAEAQFGGLVKRVIGQKVVEKVTDKGTKPEGQKADSAAGTIVPTGRAGRMRAPSDAPMASVQLTGDTLEMALRGLDALARALSRRDSLGTVADAIGKRLGELSSANVDLSRSYQEKASVVHTCRQESFYAIAQKRGEELQARAASDPGFQRRMLDAQTRYATAAAQAQAKGDTVVLRRLQMELYAAVLGASVDFRQDTLTALRKCGPELVKPATLAMEDSLRSATQHLTEQRRELEIAARTDAITKSGLSDAKFDAARERIELWYRGRRSGATHLPPAEEQALAAQLPRIERIMRAFGVQG
jgi:hypothetical protein